MNTQDQTKTPDVIELGAVSDETKGVGNTGWEDREFLYFADLPA